MAIGKWFKGLFGSEAPKSGNEETEQTVKKAAEEVEITDEFKKTFSSREKMSPEQRKSFMLSLLAMASYIVVADGRVDESETAYIGRFMGNNFGQDVEEESAKVLKGFVEKNIELQATNPMKLVQFIGERGDEMSKTLSPDLRYQLLSMLVMISKSDENLDDKELEALHDVSIYMGMKPTDVDELLDLDPELAKQGWPDLNLKKD